MRRYFAVALPLHVLDEDESIAPRLAAAAPELRDALAAMHGDHETHAPLVREVVALCADLARAPAKLGPIGRDLEAPARLLVSAMARHLADEEQLVFPAVGRLPADVQKTITAELRARRQT